MFRKVTCFSRIIRMIQQAMHDNLYEGIRLNLFGGSERDTIQYLKRVNQPNSQTKHSDYDR